MARENNLPDSHSLVCRGISWCSTLHYLEDDSSLFWSLFGSFKKWMKGSEKVSTLMQFTLKIDTLQNKVLEKPEPLCFSMSPITLLPWCKSVWPPLVHFKCPSQWKQVKYSFWSNFGKVGNHTCGRVHKISELRPNLPESSKKLLIWFNISNHFGNWIELPQNWVFISNIHTAIQFWHQPYHYFLLDCHFNFQYLSVALLFFLKK